MRKLQIAIQSFLRRLIDAPGQKDMQQLASDLERKLNARVSMFSTIVQDQIKSRSKELEESEQEMQQVATDMTLALYDAVEKIMQEVEEAKRMIQKKEEE